MTCLYSLQSAARENLIKSKIRSKAYYDKKVNAKELKIGDYVWLEKGVRKGSFNVYRTGPYKIIDVFLPNVKLQIKENKTKIVHANRVCISHIEPESENVHEND